MKDENSAHVMLVSLAFQYPITSRRCDVVVREIH